MILHHWLKVWFHLFVARTRLNLPEVQTAPSSEETGLCEVSRFERGGGGGLRIKENQKPRLTSTL